MSRDNGWDQETGNEDRVAQVAGLNFAAAWEEQRAEVENNRIAAGYFDISHIPNNTIIENFEHYTSDGERAHDRDTPDSPIGPWGINKKIWMCHNCGCFGYKQSGTFNPLFKCYSCHSRNVTVCRAGEMSLLIRSRDGVGVNMRDIYRERQENNRRNGRTQRERSAPQNT